MERKKERERVRELGREGERKVNPKEGEAERRHNEI